MNKSPFFDLLNEQSKHDFENLISDWKQDEHYIDWNQYVLPMDFGSAKDEYHAIRNSCAIFDVSPLRKFCIRGDGAGKLLDQLLTRPVSTVADMCGVYVVFCNEDGSLKDDAILHKYADDDFLLLPSDIDHLQYLQNLQRSLSIQDVSIEDTSDDWVGLAVQGPLSASVLIHMGFGGVEQLKPTEIRDYPMYGGVVRVSRMGFTADLGYECWMRTTEVPAFAQSVSDARKSLNLAIPGYGLTALDACRLEGGFIVAGWDFSTEADPQADFQRSPFELGLGWLVNLEAAKFVGRDALLEQARTGFEFTLRSFVIDGEKKPPDGTSLYDNVAGQGEVVGVIHCSSWSWDMGKIIGNASIQSRHAGLQEVWTATEEGSRRLRLSSGPLRRFKRSKEVPAPVQSE